MRFYLNAIIWVLVGIIAFFVIGGAFSSYEEDPEDLMNETSAIMYAEKAIKSHLKAPSTAEFPGFRGSNVRREGNTFYVQSYVDSQNGFGAMLRSHFEVKVTFVEDKVKTSIVKFD